MNIGIIVHSQTGHSLLVAKKLKEKLITKGNSVSIERVTAANDRETDFNSIRLTGVPNLDAFDLLIFGSPVRGNALSPVMKAFLHKAPSLKGKHVAGFVTQFFPNPKMGGNQAIQQLIDICKSKGAILTETGIVNWINPLKRRKQIADTVDKIAISLLP